MRDLKNEQYFPPFFYSVYSRNYSFRKKMYYLVYDIKTISSNLVSIITADVNCVFENFLK